MRIGRVSKDEVERTPLTRELCRSGIDIAAADLRAPCELRTCRILRENGMCRAVDEHGGRRPTRECLQRERPRPSKEIEHARIDHTAAEHTEKCLTRAIGSRARPIPRRRFQARTACAPRDDPHRIPPASH